jgi:hypothetical protein
MRRKYYCFAVMVEGEESGWGVKQILKEMRIIKSVSLKEAYNCTNARKFSLPERAT